MSNEALEALVWRDYKPLLDLLKKNPKQFDETIHKAVGVNCDYQGVTRITDPLKGNDIDILQVELLRIKEELNERIGGLTQELRDFGS